MATKCTFCVDRIDAGLAKGLTPGIDPEATPACVNACISEALTFGDLDDPQSNVSQLLAANQHFRMHEELGTGPGLLLSVGPQRRAPCGVPALQRLRTPRRRELHELRSQPWQQQHWDWRAAGNFICGGAGGGLIVFTALPVATGAAGSRALLLVAGIALVGIGLLCVWLELGRPLRALNVFRNPRTSWMTREAIAATLLLRRWRPLAVGAGSAAPFALTRPRRCALAVRLLPGPHAAGGQGHPGLARAAGAAA